MVSSENARGSTGAETSVAPTDVSPRDDLEAAFLLLDADCNGRLDASEVATLLANLNADADLTEVMRAADQDSNGSLDLVELRHALAMSTFHKEEEGRYFVALSLAEAEAVRALLHAAAEQGQEDVLGGDATAIALRSGANGPLLDASRGFSPAFSAQHAAGSASLSFINSEYEFSPRQVGALLRSLQSESCSERLRWWLAVRSCRRRPDRDWQATPLAKIFTVASEQSLLRRSAMVSAVHRQLRTKKLYVQVRWRPLCMPCFAICAIRSTRVCL